jgi:hypothetical protein
MNVPYMDDQAHVPIGVHRVDQQVRVVEQVLAVWPIPEHRHRQRMPTIGVVVVGKRGNAEHGGQKQGATGNYSIHALLRDDVHPHEGKACYEGKMSVS